MEFANGQSVSTISLTIKDDDVAELSEVTFIQLVAVVNAGTDLPSRGAFIGKDLCVSGEETNPRFKRVIVDCMY